VWAHLQCPLPRGSGVPPPLLRAGANLQLGSAAARCEMCGETFRAGDVLFHDADEGAWQHNGACPCEGGGEALDAAQPQQPQETPPQLGEPAPALIRPQWDAAPSTLSQCQQAPSQGDATACAQQAQQPARDGVWHAAGARQHSFAASQASRGALRVEVSAASALATAAHAIDTAALANCAVQPAGHTSWAMPRQCAAHLNDLSAANDAAAAPRLDCLALPASAAAPPAAAAQPQHVPAPRGAPYELRPVPPGLGASNSRTCSALAPSANPSLRPFQAAARGW